MLKPIKSTVHTITSDNGKEFSQHQLISKELNADFSFARPNNA
jgi:IS30 family transposase